MSEKTETEAELRHEALLGAVDEDGDIIWSGSPRSMFKPNQSGSGKPAQTRSAGTPTQGSSPHPQT